MKKGFVNLFLLGAAGGLLVVTLVASLLFLRQRQIYRGRAACDPNAPDIQKPGGCGDPNCCCSWEVYVDGCCRSTAGCEKDSDCLPGKKCINGVCQDSQWQPHCGGTQWQCPCGSNEEKCIGGKLYRCGNDCCLHDTGKSCSQPIDCSQWHCDPGFHCEMRNGRPTCVTDYQATPTPGGTGSCRFNPQYQAGLLANAPNPDPNCEKPPQNGIYCNDGKINYCCYADGRCYQGQQGNCRDLGNGSIWLAGGITTEIIYFWEPRDVSCPFSKASPDKTERVTVPAGGAVYSLPADKCGQIEAVGYCGSCKPSGCRPTPPTAPPTSPQYQAECRLIRAYDQNWQPISDFSRLEPGTLIYLAVAGATNEPSGFTKARFRINGGAWQETTARRGEEFILNWSVPGPGNYRIEAQVYNPRFGWR